MSARACHYCKSTTRRLTRDHIVPLSRGGVDKSWNAVKACEPCNKAKGSDWPTCICPFCNAAIQRQPWAWRGPIAERPNGRPPRHPEGMRHEGPACPDCGEITMTPNDCPWCGNEGIA